MEKDVSSSLFVNDGSFLEKFKQLQQEKQDKAAVEDSKSNIPRSSTAPLKPSTPLNKKPLDAKVNDAKKNGSSSSGGKLAFSLKQKSKVVPSIKLVADEDDDEGITEKEFDERQQKRQRLGHTKVSEPAPDKRIVAPSPPSDPVVKNVADKLASFVAKSGRHFEDITRQKNPGDTPFRFLFDTSCSDYKYYEYRLLDEERVLAISKDSRASGDGAGSSSTSGSRVSSGSQRNSHRKQSNYQTPASALYESSEDSGLIKTPTQAAVGGKTPVDDESGEVAPTDPIAMMEFYMKKAAQEERKRQPRHSKDEMPPPASLQAPPKKGHHMGDYIPQEELVKFLSTCNDAAAQKAAKEAAEKAKIQADNVGHKLLSKMGWKEGEGLGSSRSGRADPVMAGNVKLNNLGVGAEQPGEVTPDDDIYEQYKKRMMLGYRHRPNPLNNPRKAYY